MARFFNTSGPCEPADHYMLPPAERLSEARQLIDMKRYFVVHAPRQTGKTTTVAALAASLNAEARYAALMASCEEAQAVGEDINRAVDAILRDIEKKAARLSQELRPSPVESVAHIDGPSRLGVYLTRWAERSPKPIVLFLDEIDSVKGNALVSVLRQIRASYPSRPTGFPHAMALIGMRDVRDYKSGDGIDRPPGEIEGGDHFGTASPFNIKDRSLLLPNFIAEEVATLYQQHTEETGQEFTAEAKARAYELTRGQPWLVNALAQQITLTDVTDPEVSIDVEHVEAAKETLIRRRDTHLDSLLARLREKRVRGVMEPLLAGEYLEGDVMDDDIQFTEDLGLIVSSEMGLEIANPIYREIVPRVLTSTLEKQLRVVRAPYVAPDGRLLFDRFLDDFRSFWLANAELFLKRQPYSEAAAEMIFMAYLQKLINGGGYRPGTSFDREFAVGSGRVDLLVTWPLPDGGVERFAVELKVRRRDRDPDPLDQGLEQLSDYLDLPDLGQGARAVAGGRLVSGRLLPAGAVVSRSAAALAITMAADLADHGPGLGRRRARRSARRRDFGRRSEPSGWKLERRMSSSPGPRSIALSR